AVGEVLEALRVERQERVVEVGRVGGGESEPDEHLERDAAERDLPGAEVRDAVVPGVADGGEDAADESGALHHEGARARAGRRDRRTEPRASAARDEHVGLDHGKGRGVVVVHGVPLLGRPFWSAPIWYVPNRRGGRVLLSTGLP